MAVGGIIRESKKVTSNYTIVEQDEIIYVDTSGGAITLTLAKPTNDNLVTIKIVDSTFATTIITEDNKTIDGASSYTLTSGSISLAYFIDGSANEFKVIGGETNKGYKSYVATLTQSGTNPPVATVLKNELSGVPTWGYFAVGSYFMTLTGEFTEGKTIVLHNTTGQTATASILAYWEDVNTIYYESLSADVYANDNFYNNHSIEVRVYD